jgi:hypothetical protein
MYNKTDDRRSSISQFIYVPVIHSYCPGPAYDPGDSQLWTRPGVIRSYGLYGPLLYISILAVKAICVVRQVAQPRCEFKSTSESMSTKLCTQVHLTTLCP